MSDNTQQLECDVMKLLLDGDDPVLQSLREQYALVKETRKEHTGVGSYVYFTLEDAAVPLPGTPSFIFGDVQAEVEGLEIGGGFLLSVKDGILHDLETFSYDDAWPESIAGYKTKYEPSTGRDLATLRKTPGWPKL